MFFRKKLPNRIEDGLDIIFKIIFIIILLMGAYVMYDKIYVYTESSNHSLIYATHHEWTPEIEEEYPAAVAWLYIEDTINEPLVQGVDNMEYLNKGPDGQYSLRGSLYIDSRNDPCMEDDYTLLYGHHMAYYKMFGALDYYFDEGYWTPEHTHGVITLKNGTECPFRIVAIGSIDASVAEIFQPTEHTTEEVIDVIMKPDTMQITHINSVDELEDQRLLMLSTCQTPDSTLRTCVLAIFEEE